MQLTPDWGPHGHSEQPVDEYRHSFSISERHDLFIFFRIAVSFIDAFQMATNGGTCAINNKKK